MSTQLALLLSLCYVCNRFISSFCHSWALSTRKSTILLGETAECGVVLMKTIFRPQTNASEKRSRDPQFLAFDTCGSRMIKLFPGVPIFRSKFGPDAQLRNVASNFVKFTKSGQAQMQESQLRSHRYTAFFNDFHSK